MANPKDKSIEELEKFKLQSEIDRNRAEQSKLENEAKEVAKRLDQKKLFGIPVSQTIVGGLVAGVFIIGFSWNFLTPVLNKDAQIATRQARLQDVENKLERALLDSSNRVLAAQKDRLEKQVQLITARLDSSNKRKQQELNRVQRALAAEKDKTQTNQRRVKALASQVSGLQQDIKRAETEKQEIERIAASPYLSEGAVARMLKEKGYFCRKGLPWSNPAGGGIVNQFELLKNGQVVYDAATGLTWQQSGSRDRNFSQAGTYIQQLNHDKYAGFSDWRLPTLEEAMSLVEPKENESGLYIDSVFDKAQGWIWTADKASVRSAWYVYFSNGYCGRYVVGLNGFVRAVR